MGWDQGCMPVMTKPWSHETVSIFWPRRSCKLLNHRDNMLTGREILSHWQLTKFLSGRLRLTIEERNFAYSLTPGTKKYPRLAPNFCNNYPDENILYSSSVHANNNFTHINHSRYFNSFHLSAFQFRIKLFICLEVRKMILILFGENSQCEKDFGYLWGHWD